MQLISFIFRISAKTEPKLLFLSGGWLFAFALARSVIERSTKQQSSLLCLEELQGLSINRHHD
jgi:hypothetical protein